MKEIITNMDVTTLGGFSVHLLASAFLGAIIGLERQFTRHAAGIITTLLVCMGSYAFTSFSFLAINDGGDITRVASGIVQGIGFIGAGVIIREGGNIRGINTAATVWASGAVGILCCVRNLLYATIVALAIVFLHLALHPVSNEINKIKRYDKRESRRKQEAEYKISVVCPEDEELDVRKNIMSIIKHEPEALLHTLETVNTHDGNNTKKIRAYITTKTDNDALIENLITQVGKNDKVISTGWKAERGE